MEQKINTRKTDEGYYVEVLNDGKLAWTGTFKKRRKLNWFIEICARRRYEGFPYLSQEEGREWLGYGGLFADVFYRHPKGYWTALIFNLGTFTRNEEHGFDVSFYDKDGNENERYVPTIDEAFQLIKDVEDGKV